MFQSLQLPLSTENIQEQVHVASTKTDQIL